MQLIIEFSIDCGTGRTTSAFLSDFSDLDSENCVEVRTSSKNLKLIDVILYNKYHLACCQNVFPLIERIIYRRLLLVLTLKCQIVSSIINIADNNYNIISILKNKKHNLYRHVKKCLRPLRFLQESYKGQFCDLVRTHYKPFNTRLTMSLYLRTMLLYLIILIILLVSSHLISI